MISLKEASAYFHMGIKKMRRMTEDNEGGFALFLGNRYIICRPKLEEYLLKVMANSRTEQEICILRKKSLIIELSLKIC